MYICFYASIKLNVGGLYMFLVAHNLMLYLCLWCHSSQLNINTYQELCICCSEYFHLVPRKVLQSGFSSKNIQFPKMFHNLCGNAKCTGVFGIRKLNLGFFPLHSALKGSNSMFLVSAERLHQQKLMVLCGRSVSMHSVQHTQTKAPLKKKKNYNKI